MIFIYMLVCAGHVSCPLTPIYSSKIYYSLESCRKEAPLIAASMHYKQGGDWSWKCFEATYKPKELP